ncbi:MAG TPA: phosphatase PAP2 family protein, partial [Chitinophagaceae bacterium]|nr:phosphatase PAP2 family protein [Chitinophagaceae bacterium]
MKQILACAFLLTACICGYSQTDTTKKAVDSTIIDSSMTNVSLTDTVTLHAAEPVTEKKGKVYRIKPAVDLPIIAGTTAWAIHGFKVIYDKPSSPEARILSLNKGNISKFDRSNAGYYSESSEKTSDLFFYGSMPLPLLLMLDADIRKDAGNILLMYWETMGVLGIFYTGSAYVVDRYRPFVYGNEAPMHERTSGNAKNSFIGGHPALVATSTFFVAKVFSDYHKDSKIKWVFYTLASGATLATAYLRYDAGKHFKSDLIAGTAIGTAVGILVPH